MNNLGVYEVFLKKSAENFVEFKTYCNFVMNSKMN